MKTLQLIGLLNEQVLPQLAQVKATTAMLVSEEIAELLIAELLQRFLSETIEEPVVETYCHPDNIFKQLYGPALFVPLSYRISIFQHLVAKFKLNMHVVSVPNTEEVRTFIADFVNQGLTRKLPILIERPNDLIAANYCTAQDLIDKYEVEGLLSTELENYLINMLVVCEQEHKDLPIMFRQDSELDSAMAIIINKLKGVYEIS